MYLGISSSLQHSSPEECACGEGTLDINLYAQLSTAENPRMPMIIEHLTTDDEYVASVKYVKDRLSKQ